MKIQTVKVKSYFWNYKSTYYNENPEYKSVVRDLIKVALKPCMRGVTIVYNNGYHKNHTVRG